MFPRLWAFLNPRRWFGARNATPLALPAPPIEVKMEVQESPDPTPPPEPVREISDASVSFMSYKSAHSEASPYRSESASPQRSPHTSDYEMKDVMEVVEQKEKKLHELSDADESSFSDEDDEEDEEEVQTQFKTPTNVLGPSNLRRTSLVVMKRHRKLTGSSDEDAPGTSVKRAKNSSPSKATPSSSTESSATSESSPLVVSEEAIRVSTRIIRKPSQKLRESTEGMGGAGGKEGDTPTSSRKNVSPLLKPVKRMMMNEDSAVAHVKVERVTKKTNVSPALFYSTNEKSTSYFLHLPPSSTASGSRSRDSRSTTPPMDSVTARNLRAASRSRDSRSPAPPMDSVTARNLRAASRSRDAPATPARKASLRTRDSFTPAPTSGSERPKRACRAFTVSPSSYFRNDVSPPRSNKSLKGAAAQRGRAKKKE